MSGYSLPLGTAPSEWPERPTRCKKAAMERGVVDGLGFGGLMPLFGMLTAARFGAARLGRMMGAAGPVMLPFQLFGLPFAAAVFDRTGSYTPAFATFLAFFVAAALILWQLPGGSVEDS